MTAFPHWTDTDPLWDTLYLGGVAMPGAWRIEGYKERGVDRVKVPDQDGFTLTNKGYSGASISAVGQLWLRQQLDDFWALANDFDPEFVTQATPYDLYHPAAEILWVGLVFVRKLAVKGPDKGVFTITLDFDQWMPETKVEPTRNSAKAKGNDNPASKLQGFDGAQTGGSKPLAPEDFDLELPTP